MREREKKKRGAKVVVFGDLVVVKEEQFNDAKLGGTKELKSDEVGLDFAQRQRESNLKQSAMDYSEQLNSRAKQPQESERSSKLEPGQKEGGRNDGFFMTGVSHCYLNSYLSRQTQEKQTNLEEQFKLETRRNTFPKISSTLSLTKYFHIKTLTTTRSYL